MPVYTSEQIVERIDRIEKMLSSILTDISKIELYGNDKAVPACYSLDKYGVHVEELEKRCGLKPFIVKAGKKTLRKYWLSQITEAVKLLHDHKEDARHPESSRNIEEIKRNAWQTTRVQLRQVSHR